MTSSEKILAGITAEAEHKASEIIAEAEKNAQKVISEKKAKAEEETVKIRAAAKKKAELIESSGKSAAALLQRDALLAKKRELIEKSLNATLDSINNYDDKKYFDCLLGLIKKSAMEQSGEIFLSSRDLSRDLTEFKKSLSALNLKIGTEPAIINGGFVLKYNDILINGELSAIIREKRDEIIDSVNAVLFG